MMRQSLLALLLLSVAAPALAGPGGQDRGTRPSVERVREPRSDDDNDGRSKQSGGEARSTDFARPRMDVPRRSVEQTGPRREAPVNRSQDLRQRSERAGQADTVRTWRERERDGVRSSSPAVDRPLRRTRTRSADAVTAPTRVVRQDGRRAAVDLSRTAVASKWRSDWRRDRRYDWRSHRARNRSLFHLGFYYDPFGYSYRRFGYGYSLFPAYYSSRYWLNDPFMYRLPFVGWPYQWVRYWDDALLVDTRNGMVVDTIYDFFW